MELLYSNPVVKTVIQTVLLIQAHFVHGRPSERGQSRNASFTLESTLVINHCFSIRREDLKKLDVFCRFMHSLSEMGLEYCQNFFCYCCYKQWKSLCSDWEFIGRIGPS